MQYVAKSIVFILFISLFFIGKVEVQAVEKIVLQEEELRSYALGEWEQGFIQWDKLYQLMNQLDDQISKAPMDATLDKDFKIVQAKLGLKLDRDTFIKDFLKAFYEGEEAEFQLETKPVHARVDEEILQEITRKKLGTYTTFFNATNEERSKNVKLSAEAIHGTVIFPGEVFSFNETVGERTEERGYERAPVIVEGEFAEDIGGGICQVSSTLFNAVDLRGVQMIERFTHSRPVPYVPPGRDATVSWWGPDFTFKNLYNEPIIITAMVENGTLTVEVFSSETVEYFDAHEKSSTS